jgi:NAD+ synthase
MITEKVVEYIVSWLKDYAEKSKVNGFVIGISGGIDSAVTSTLCAKTGFPLLCLEMPIHQAENQITRAHNHIEWLQKNFKKISVQQVNLTPVFDSLIAVFPKAENEEQLLMSLANTRARLRMTT